MVSAGLISLGGYVPAKEVPKKQQNPLVDFLRSETLLHADYIAEINDSGHLPGKIETNYDGWESQPWFQGWVKKLPPHKQQDPFQGTKERRRVPLDPVSIRESVTSHPMLSSDAETLAGALAIFNGGIDKNEIPLFARYFRNSLKILTVVFHNLYPSCQQCVNFQRLKGMGK